METPDPIPPRLNLPPVIEPRLQLPPEPEKPKNVFQKAWGGFVAFILAVWKYAYFILKFGKIGKLLLTAGSMLLSIGLYSMLFGWQFALGFVICIFIHEMGHVFAAWRLKMEVSAPIFIPGMGALILTKRTAESGWKSAVIGIGGPTFGALAAFGCWGLYRLTQMPIYLALAYTAFFLNLFNMLPMYPLDGGWITGAISPYIWIIGLIGFVALVLTGHISNPFLIVLLILSVPRIVTALKRGTMDLPGAVTTKTQKAVMGVAYLALVNILLFGMSQTRRTPDQIRQRSFKAIQGSPE